MADPIDPELRDEQNKLEEEAFYAQQGRNTLAASSIVPTQDAAVSALALGDKAGVSPTSAALNPSVTPPSNEKQDAVSFSEMFRTSPKMAQWAMVDGVRAAAIKPRASELVNLSQLNHEFAPPEKLGWAESTSYAAVKGIANTGKFAFGALSALEGGVYKLFGGDMWGANRPVASL